MTNKKIEDYADCYPENALPDYLKKLEEQERNFMTTAKPTKGPWKVGKNTLYVPWRFITADDNGFEKHIAFLEGGKQEVLANGALIVEASTVYHETGLTPRQLDDQRRELLEALENVLAIADRKHDAFDKAHKAIAKAKGESC